jgi:hypothetical protein
VADEEVNFSKTMLAASSRIYFFGSQYWNNFGGVLRIIQGGSNMTGTNCDLFTHKSSRSYLNHLVYGTIECFDSLTCSATILLQHNIAGTGHLSVFRRKGPGGGGGGGVLPPYLV